MAWKATKNHVKEILELLKQGTAELILSGEARTGKTWMARSVSESAFMEGYCYATLWLSLDNNYDENSLYDSVADQLSLLTWEEEWEDDDFYKLKKEESVENLKTKITAKLKEPQENKFLLLVLDREGQKMTEDDIRNKLGLDSVLNKEPGDSYKVLITTNKSEEEPITSETRKIRKVEPLSGEEASTLLEASVKVKVWASVGFKELCEAIKRRSNVLPDEVIMLAGSLNYFARGQSRLPGLEHALQLALDAAAYVQTSLLQCAYDMLPNDCMINCFWHCWNFLGKHGSVNYNELITHWIMEGYLDPTNHMEQAYEMGHNILMELIDRGMLRMQEDNMIGGEAAFFNVNDLRCHGFRRLANLGLASVLQDEERKVFERITPGDGMIKTLGDDQKMTKVSSLLIDGSHLCRVLPESFFQEQESLKVLSIFNPRLKMFPFSTSKMDNLLLLLLRGSYLLEDCNHIAKLKALKALEISGASYLEEIQDGLFDELPQLRSLNLSALGIKFLPSSVSNLTELRRLILRKCFSLEELPRLDKLEKLEVLDLSGCTSLTRIHNKCFKSQVKLQVLDFSATKIEKLPIVKFLKDLTRLSLRGCKCLTLLRCLRGLSNLKIVDLSGAIKIMEINDDCFEKTDNLRLLDLSNTEIQCLPSSIGNLCDLKLKGCSSLENLPTTTRLEDLECLDLSDATSLIKIEDESFTHLKRLYHLNLSNTKVASLPSLCKLANLRKILLKNCSSLEKLPDMKGLTRLEVFDLSGCKALTEIGHEAFNDMSRLQEVNLSETQIKHLPSFCKPRKLHSLVLRDCIKLLSVQGVESLSELEVLDMSGTESLSEINAESLNHMTQLQKLKLSKLSFQELSSISCLINLQVLSLNDCSQADKAEKSLPSLETLSNLRELSLRGFSGLKELPQLKSLIHLEVLDLSKSGVEKLPAEISELANLKCLHLPDLKLFEEVRWKNIKRLELHWDQCSISKSSEILSDVKKFSLVVHSARFFKSLKQDPKLLETTLKLFKQLIFSIHSSKLQCQDKDDSQHNGELICSDSDVDFKIRNFPPDGKDEHSLEIQGFNAFPADIGIDIQDVLKQTEYISLVENEFLRCLSDLNPENLEKIKGCWIQRCTEMKSIFNETIAEIGERVEILRISSLPNLEGLCNVKEHPLGFRKLKHLYLDYCPMLETVFCSSQLPESLEILQIKFCDRLKTLFEDKEEDKSEGPSISLINLKELSINSCPMLENVFPSVPENLEIIQIKSCDKLQTLCGQDDLAYSELAKLRMFHLLALPELTSIGFRLQKPFFKNVKGCPKLQIKESLISGITSAEITRT